MAPIDLAARFFALHHGRTPLLLANAWSIGSARLFASMGFRALATTSSGHAASLGRLDGQLTRDEALEHVAELVKATDLPVNADLESGFADDPTGVAETFKLAARTGLAGASIEDFTGDAGSPIYGLDLAAERVRAAAEAFHRGPAPLVLTGRAENFLHGRPDLADTIRRLQAYQEAGADVLYAPGLTRLEDIRSVVASVDRPVNVLAMAGIPDVSELSSVGVSRISVGGAFAFAAFGAAFDAARELLEQGTYGYTSRSTVGRKITFTRFGA
ncbi:isocitrate lyase/phosphoenolpyruvate mutase family protein [Arthrobacter sp. H5]|uniref:isocitrate lyase/PEP mutase family protein n=1 Tax=Arthrobacter sp. H5 TaxID=1267973 RepID=UPI000563840F|nr:isocitrate lyase/phosphoenolpyruvate mutase family protein [Arthrobacter sp. H5]